MTTYCPPLPTSSLDVLERVRACVAEAGYDPGYVTGHSEGTLKIDRRLPSPVIWRARELADMGTPRCLACGIAGRRMEGLPSPLTVDCLATERFVEDCGADR